MTPAQLAQRIAALDWSALPLQHQLAVTAAVLTLENHAMPDSNVLPFRALFPPPLTAAQLRGCEYVPARRVMLTRLDGTPFADALVGRAGGAAWDWVVETVANELGCCPEDIHADDDTVTVDGIPCFIIAVDI